MGSQARANGVCETTRALPFQAATVFAAFAQAQWLAQWRGPDGFINAFGVFEFKPQGRGHLVMIGHDHQRYPNQSVVLETSLSQAVIRHLSPPHFTLTVALTAHGDSRVVHWRQVFEDPAVAAAVWHIIEPANGQNLNRLHALLADLVAR